MRRILFVDDEQRILDGLRDLLRKQRKQWDMVFTLGGEQALTVLEHAAFDVVISDMQMPGMDGATLLRHVMQRHPSTTRIILSGHAERQAVIDALPVTHQFLSKPCDADRLRSVIERACRLQDLLRDERVRSAVGSVDRLPPVPGTYRAFSRALAEPGVRLSELAEIVQSDAALTGKVLQLVNSSFFAAAQKQTSAAEAIAYLGTDLLRALALAPCVFSPPAGRVSPSFSLEALQQHSVEVARIARGLPADQEQAAQAFTAALLHDIGKLVLAVSMPERYEAVLQRRRVTGQADHVVEAELLGVTHAEVGAYLLGSWGLPLELVEAVAYHHRPELTTPTEILLAVNEADVLSHSRVERLRA